MLLGDYLFARAIALFQRDVPSLNAKRKQAILVLVSAMTVRMIQGELLQERSRGNLAVDEDAYLKMIALKTGEGFGCARKSRRFSRTRTAARRSRFRCYGQELGIAYQIMDDLVDLTLGEDDAGKATGADLRWGLASLAVIRLLKDCNTHDRRLVARAMSDPGATALRAVARSVGRARETRGSPRPRDAVPRPSPRPTRGAARVTVSRCPGAAHARAHVSGPSAGAWLGRNVAGPADPSGVVAEVGGGGERGGGGGRGGRGGGRGGGRRRGGGGVVQGSRLRRAERGASWPRPKAPRHG